ncbi:MAG TPA: hypothetical protein DDW65_04395 [Firmicutes bacterium]|jgi:signal transduction histidine kinase/DNA-binding response OmpR family regulator|nr:hypothetical protein [Bacillota bacterium]
MKTEKVEIKVLYVEDEASIRESIVEMLQRRITMVYTAQNGQEGLELFNQYHPEIIITDLQMPVMDGLTMAKEIKTGNKAVPIIITTAYNETDYFLKAIDIGINHYILKPVHFPKLFAAIDECWNIILLNRKVKQQEADLRQAYDELESRVEKRTMELTRTNELLKAEVIERQKAENKALETCRQNQQLMSIISSIVIGVSGNDLVMQWNAAAEKAFSIPESEVIGLPFRECRIHWDWDRLLHAIAMFRKQTTSTNLDDYWYVRPGGDKGLISLSINPIQVNLNAPAAFFLFGVDVTSRKKLEAQAILSQKMESIGRLASGIAHEINTPTQYIGDNIRFFQKSFGDIQNLLILNSRLLEANQSGNLFPELCGETDSFMKSKDMEYILSEIPLALTQSLDGNERVTKIMLAMKDFSHPGQGEKMLTDINKALEGTITISRNEWKYVADLETNFERNLPLVNCIVDEINQVALNLIINAADAIKEVVKNDATRKEKILIKTSQNGNWVQIHFNDTGVGITDHIMDKIFDPFFTTKEVGKGTGQGLSIVHDIVVNKHQGEITVDSDPGKGTTFVVSLPIGEL